MVAEKHGTFILCIGIVFLARQGIVLCGKNEDLGSSKKNPGEFLAFFQNFSEMSWFYFIILRIQHTIKLYITSLCNHTV